MFIQDGTELIDDRSGAAAPDAPRGDRPSAQELLAQLAPFRLGQRTLRELEQLVGRVRRKDWDAYRAAVELTLIDINPI